MKWTVVMRVYGEVRNVQARTSEEAAAMIKALFEIFEADDYVVSVIREN